MAFDQPLLKGYKKNVAFFCTSLFNLLLNGYTIEKNYGSYGWVLKIIFRCAAGQ